MTQVVHAVYMMTHQFDPWRPYISRSRNERGSAGTLGIPRYLPYTIVKRARPRFPAGAHLTSQTGCAPLEPRTSHASPNRYGRRVIVILHMTRSKIRSATPQFRVDDS